MKELSDYCCPILQNYCSKLCGDYLRLLYHMKNLEALIFDFCGICFIYIFLVHFLNSAYGIAFTLSLYAFLAFVALFLQISIKVWLFFLATVRNFLTLMFYSLFQTIEILFSKRILLNMEVRYLHLFNLIFPFIIFMLVSKSFFYLMGY